MKSICGIVIVAGLMVCGCHAAKETQVKAGGDAPGIIVTDAPDDSILFVDGVRAGEAEKFDGKDRYLALKPGVHTVEIKSEAGRLLVKQTVYLDSEIKTIPMASR